MNKMFTMIENAVIEKRPMNATRKEAIKQGLRYYNGNPCARKHSGIRLTKDGQCKECRSILRAKYNDKNRARARKWELKKNFKISVEEYNILLKAQNGLCAICDQPETTKSSRGTLKQLAVDHCHTTYKIRGLLCFTCNMGIGYLKHDPTFLRKAALYCEAV